MSRTGKRIIDRMPEHSDLHDPNNPMHGLTDHGIGKWFDQFEEDMWLHVDKRHIISNISDENDIESHDYVLSGKFLDIQGKEYGVFRKLGENNTDFRARILSIVQNDITIKGIKAIVASVLNVTDDQVEVTNNREHFCTGDPVGSCLMGTKSKPVYNHLVNARGVIFIKVHEVEDIAFLKGVLENCVLANVEIVLLYSKVLLVAGNPSFANEGDNVTFTVMLVDQSDMALSGKPVFFYNNDEYLGSGETDSEGRASFNINDIRSGRYNLKARYSKTWSETHPLTVKRALTLILDGATTISEEESLTYTVSAYDGSTSKVVENLVVEFYVDGKLHTTQITDREGKASFKYLVTDNGQFEISARVRNDNIYHDTLSNSILLNVNLYEEVGPDDLLITLKIPTGLTSYEIEDLKEEALEKDIFGEKIPLYNFPFHAARLFLNSTYSNVRMYHKRRKLRHHFTKKFNIPLYTIEVPYSRFEEELEITIIVYADESKMFPFEKDIFRHYYDIADGIPKGFIYDKESNRPRVDFVVRSMEDDSIIPRPIIKIAGQTYTGNNNGYVRIDNLETGWYNIEVSKFGYFDRVFDREIDFSKELTVRLNEKTSLLDVEFTVLNENSEPVDNATITINNTTVTTNNQGKALISDITPGTINIKFVRKGYKTQFLTDTLTKSKQINITAIKGNTFDLNFKITDNEEG